MSSQPVKPQLSQEAKASLDAFLHQAVQNDLPATTLAVTAADGPLYFACKGERVPGVPGEAIDDRTILQLGSMTKLVTAVSVLTLADSANLDLDDASLVEKHAPELVSQLILTRYTNGGDPILQPRKEAITLRRLLSHSAGLAYPYRSLAPHLGRWCKEHGVPNLFAPNTGIEKLTFPLAYEPGTKWLYSPGLDWACVILERITGAPLEDYIQKHLFGPLGVSAEDVTFYPTSDTLKRLQRAAVRKPDGTYAATPGNRGLDALVDDPSAVGQILGGSGLLATSKAYLRLLQAILASNPAEPLRGQVPLLSPAGWTALFSDVLPPDGPGHTAHADVSRVGGRLLGEMVPAHPVKLAHGAGHALYTADSPNGPKKGSGTWEGATRTSYWIDPASGIAGVVCTQLIEMSPVHWVKVRDGFQRLVYDSLCLR